MLVQDICDHTVARHVAEKLMCAINLPIHSAAGEHRVGISLFPDDGSELDCLMRNADQAMYRAKHAGRNGICRYCSGALQA